MESQLALWDEYLKSRDVIAKAAPGLWEVKNALTEEVYKEGALSTKVKRLMGLVGGLRAGCTTCVIGQTQLAIAAGATNEEIFEAIGVGTAMSGTPGLAEAGRVFDLLKELGRL
ncbi:MAG: carboxymuconolactone decarboxylase family protein [Dehalococcoidia bacterium]|nr:carboxymuconolactone decarboxylase family protein [Dehalococcoidia bacterium]